MADIFRRMTAAAAAFKGVPIASGGVSGGSIMTNLLNLLPGSGYDYERAVGDTWKNSLVMAAIKWTSNTFPEAPMQVLRPDKDGKEQVQPGHAILELLNRPNPYQDGTVLWAATILADFCYGNAYWLKVRNKLTGSVTQLHWLPPWTMTPRWNEKDPDSFIDYWEYRVANEVWKLDPADVVHFQNGIDPDNNRLGLGPLTSTLREIATDNEASTYTGALLRNMGIPGLVVKPTKDESGISTQVNKASADEMKRTFKERFGGDNRGAPWILKTAMDVMMLSFNPRDMAMDVVRQLPEERVSAVLGIPAIVLGFGAGLKRSTFSNMKEAREAAYESCIVPMQRRYASAIDHQLLRSEAQFKALPGDRVAFDLTRVRALQDDQNELYNRAAIAFKSGFIKRSEAKAMVGLPWDASDEVYITELPAMATGGSLGSIAGLPDGAPKAFLTLLEKATSSDAVFAAQLQELQDHLGVGYGRLATELTALDEAA